MKTTILLITLVAAACGKSSDSKSEPAPAKGAEAPPPDPTPVEPAKPAAPTPDLIKVATDAGQPGDARRTALEDLGKRKDPTAGVPLFEAAKVEKDFILRGELFRAAGQSGGEATEKAMLAHYASKESKEHRTEMRSGLRELDRGRVFAFAAERFAKAGDMQVEIADLVIDTEGNNDPAKVVELLGKCKDRMACHRLARVAVKLGATDQLKVLIDGLKSKDEYDRSDAANMLADVADAVPAERRAEVVDLVKAARAKDQGGLTSVGYDAILKKLGN
jgi:HEAT repeat protein